MKHRVGLLTTSILLVGFLPATAASAVTAPAAVTYHGQWTGIEDHCAGTGIAETLSGVWNATIRRDDAVMHVEVHRDGRLGAAWGGKVWGEFFTVESRSRHGFVVTDHVGQVGQIGDLTLRFTLSDEGVMRYDIFGYGCPAGITLWGQESN